MTFRMKRLAVLGAFIVVAIGLAYLPAGEGFCNPQGFSDVPYSILNIVAFSVLGMLSNALGIDLPRECPGILHLVAITNLFILLVLIFFSTIVRAIATFFPSASQKGMPVWLAFAIAFIFVFVGAFVLIALMLS